MNEVLYNYILIKGVENDKILVIRSSRDPNTKEILKDVELKLTKAEKKDISSICAKFIEDNKDSILQYSYEHVPTKKTIKKNIKPLNNFNFVISATNELNEMIELSIPIKLMLPDNIKNLINYIDKNYSKNISDKIKDINTPR